MIEDKKTTVYGSPDMEKVPYIDLENRKIRFETPQVTVKEAAFEPDEEPMLEQPIADKPEDTVDSVNETVSAVEEELEGQAEEQPNEYVEEELEGQADEQFDEEVEEGLNEQVEEFIEEHFDEQAEDEPDEQGEEEFFFGADEQGEAEEDVIGQPSEDGYPEEPENYAGAVFEAPLTEAYESEQDKKDKIRRKYMLLDDENTKVAKIVVIGVGGAGNNAVNRMIEAGVNTAKFIAVNTDRQALMLSKCNPEDRYQIGSLETKGLGAGADPEIGEKAALESKELIEQLVDGVDLLFIAAGMGGGTGTGAAPVIAKIAKSKGCVTVAVVTKPFSFEGRRREKNAEKGIANLEKHADTMIIIPNDKLMEAMRPDTPFIEALKFADDTLRQGICGIADLIATPSLINLDFADVRTTLKDQGLAHMGIGAARGENRIIEAVKGAVSSPLLETTIEGAMNIILNVTGGNDLTLRQVDEAARYVREIVDPEANVIFGTNINNELSEEVIITLIATGFNAKKDDSEENTRAYKDMVEESSARRSTVETVAPAAKPETRVERNPERGYGAARPERREQYPEYPDENNTHVDDDKGDDHDDQSQNGASRVPGFVRRLFGGGKK